MLAWLNLESWNLALFVLLLGGALVGGIHAARRGRLPTLRPIPGVAALEEAVGRAAEMGRPLFYVAGVRDLDDVQTVASLSILGAVAEMTARHQVDLTVPTDRSMVMAAAREICHQSYVAAGRADAFHEGMVTYVSDEQFAFAAKVDGLIARQQPAACLLLGSFFAESLLLAEAGHQAGAMQVAGTAGWHQLPFLVAACDYVLIGEELFAASAYLSEDPAQLGSLRGQDIGKFLAMFLMSAGAVTATLVSLGSWHWPQAIQAALVRLLQSG